MAPGTRVYIKGPNAQFRLLSIAINILIPRCKESRNRKQKVLESSISAIIIKPSLSGCGVASWRRGLLWI